MSTGAEVWERAYSKVNMILWYLCNMTPIIFLSSHWHLIQKQNFRQQDQILSRVTGRKAPYICIRGQFLHEISSITPYSTTRFTGSINEETLAWALSLFTKRTHDLQMTSLMLPRSKHWWALRWKLVPHPAPTPTPHTQVSLPDLFYIFRVTTATPAAFLSSSTPFLWVGWNFPLFQPSGFCSNWTTHNPRIWNLTFSSFWLGVFVLAYFKMLTC